MSRSWVLKEDIQNREGIKVLDLKEDDDLGHWGGVSYSDSCEQGESVW